MKQYRLRPLKPTDPQRTIERTVYVIARCLSLSNFQITEEIYNQLLKSEQLAFKEIEE